jgi:hypothetical protein
MEGITHDNKADKGDHQHLEAEDKHGGMECVMDLGHIHLEVLHNSPVEGFKGHSVGVATNLKLALFGAHLSEESIILHILQVFVHHLDFELLRRLIKQVPLVVVRRDSTLIVIV